MESFLSKPGQDWSLFSACLLLRFLFMSWLQLQRKYLRQFVLSSMFLYEVSLLCWSSQLLIQVRVWFFFLLWFFLLLLMPKSSTLMSLMKPSMSIWNSLPNFVVILVLLLLSCLTGGCRVSPQLRLTGSGCWGWHTSRVCLVDMDGGGAVILADSGGPLLLLPFTIKYWVGGPNLLGCALPRGPISI